MPIQPVEPRRLYRQIAEQIRKLIESGEFPPGSRLPAERELAQQLGVSRPSLREALISLEIAGLVDVRVGAGVFVCQPPEEAPARSHEDAEMGPFELLRARWLIEGEIAALAARSAKQQDLEAIAGLIEQMIVEDQRDGQRDIPDRLFHLRIAEATGNSALVFVVRALWDTGRGPMWQRMEAHFRTPELRRKTVEDHWAILAALETRDPKRTRAAMRRHLARVSKEFAKGWKALKPEAA